MEFNVIRYGLQAKISFLVKQYIIIFVFLLQGDSGSGIIRGNEIAGVVSRGAPCAVGYPDVYTSIYTFLPWVRQKMTL